MNYYQDITILPNEEIGLNFLWEKLYQNIHLILVNTSVERIVNQNGYTKKVKMSTVGVSFPQYGQKTLGCKMRLMAQSQQDLEKLEIKTTLAILSDYIHITSIRDIQPDKVTRYACFTRHHRGGSKANLERLISRKAKRDKISQEQARKTFKSKGQEKAGHSTAPFVRIKSGSTKSSFRLIINRNEASNRNTSNPNKGYFSTYGLSPDNPVPLF